MRGGDNSDLHGAPVGAPCTAESLSEFASAALRLLSEELRCSAVVTTDGVVAWSSPRFVERFGPPQSLTEHSSDWAELWHRLPPSCGREEGHVSHGRQATAWLSVPIPGGEARRLWLFDDGAPPAALEAALRLAQNRLRLLSAHTQGIIFEFNSLGRFVRIWASDPKLLARPEAELLGRTVSEALGTELGAFHDRAIHNALRTGQGDEYEYQLDVPGGKCWFMATSVVVPSSATSERAVIYWIRDVTQQVNLRKRNLQNERLATVGKLAAGVAHEINNPLGYMLLNLERVERRLASLGQQVAPSQGVEFDELRLSLSIIREGSERVRKIVRDLLNFSRGDDTLTKVDVTRALELAIELAAAEEQPHIQLQRTWRHVPPVLADEGRLIQVFVNLLVNAVQAIERKGADPGGGHGRLQLSARTDPQGWVVVEIEDTGTGIAVEHLPKIFDPFFTTKPQGVGLGLSLCHAIVTAISGQIEVSSEPGVGSVFRISLPLPPDNSTENALTWGEDA